MRFRRLPRPPPEEQRLEGSSGAKPEMKKILIYSDLYL